MTPSIKVQLFILYSLYLYKRWRKHLILNSCVWLSCRFPESKHWDFMIFLISTECCSQTDQSCSKSRNTNRTLWCLLLSGRKWLRDWYGFIFSKKTKQKKEVRIEIINWEVHLLRMDTQLNIWIIFSINSDRSRNPKVC